MRITDELTDSAVLAEIGARIKRLRLDRNITQASLAAEAGLSRPTLQKIEAGAPSQLLSVIRVLRALGETAGLDGLVPEAVPSPIEMLDRGGRQRRRARG